MIQVNIADHVSPAVGYIAWPHHRRDLIFWARKHAIWISKNKFSADKYFKTLPGGQSLTQLLADNSIWINYHPTSAAYGKTNFAGGKEIAIAETACRLGKWMVLATLIHELAHANGVKGAVLPQAAEDALIHCGLGFQKERDTGNDDPNTPFDPNIIGRFQIARNTRYQYA